jgi:hypothetical protein
MVAASAGTTLLVWDATTGQVILPEEPREGILAVD